MTTTHEAAVQALRAALAGALSATLTLDAERPAAVPAAGLANLLTGERDELGRRLSPEVIEWQQDCELELVATGEARRATIEALLAAAGGAVSADRTLGGAVDWVEIGPPQPLPESALSGAASARGVTVTFSLFYETGPNPLEG